MANISRARLFCCVLAPVIGVLAASYLWIISGIIIAITGWSQVHLAGAYPIPAAYSTALHFHALIFTLLGVVGIYGVAAASLKRPSLILGYLILLGLHLLLSFGGGGFLLMMINRSPSQDEITACLHQNSNDPVAAQFCYEPIAIPQGVAVTLYVLSWILELYACVMIFSYLEELKQRAANPDFETKPRRPTGSVNAATIGEPRPIPNFKPATMDSLMSSTGYPISIIDGFGRVEINVGASQEPQGIAGGVQQHTWGDGLVTPRKPTSPPTTPVTPSRPDFLSGMKPLLLTSRPATSSQPNSPHVIPPIEISTSPLHPPYGLGSAGLNTSYAFSRPSNAFGSTALVPIQASFTSGNGSDNRF
ncbi:hypothetical protein DFH05DRAFT_1529400 [Lentinula detonsa]|uniref:Uncharacterized protein n=1 Tax=Lentinula detonsa TaxID=2804962 RepID=A0A9W8NSY2_9AGAR|nr:hypothetical protein DFH05DRAFT_1529400 [Lentinula detonsa]